MPDTPADPTGGVKPFPIEGPMKDERYRLAGMTDAERAWRKQWLKDQMLSESEPRPIPGYYQERYNPIRRFYRWPLDRAFQVLVPALGYEKTAMYRWFTGKYLMAIFAVYVGFYYFKYNTQTWEENHGWQVMTSRPRVTPGDPRYPFKSDKKHPSDYDHVGFKNSPI